MGLDRPDCKAPPTTDTPPTPAAGFRCPKCGHPQARGNECTRCGIIFAKYEAMLQERAARDAGSAALTGRVDEVLRRISGFEVQQQHHVTEALLGFERANRYTLQPVPASAINGNWQVEEGNRSGISILGRNLFGTLYTFTMNVLDEGRNRVLMLERRARLYFYHLDVYDETGRRIGSARRRFSLFDRVITLHDDREQELLRIIGPYFKPWTFLLRQSGNDAGTIVKQWSGTLKEAWTDADRFSMRFSAALDARTRRLLLGAMMLIDSLYFEGRKPFLRHFFDAPGVQFVLVIAILAWLAGTPDLTRVMGLVTPEPAAERSGAAIAEVEFQRLLDRRQVLADLAGDNHYTVVEVYLDTCPICRHLERGFGQFTAKRRDVTIQRVHFPDSGIQFTPTGSTQQEVTAQARNFQARMESFRICGTPHVEIYDPDGQPVARDVCGDKSGTKFLRRWISRETTLSLRDLQTDAGADASTPVVRGN